MQYLGEFIQDNHCIEELQISNNEITNKGVEILSEHLIANSTIKKLYLLENRGVSEASVPTVIEMIKKSNITEMDIWSIWLSSVDMKEIEMVLHVPLDQRENQIKSNTKSAAKISSASR